MMLERNNDATNERFTVQVSAIQSHTRCADVVAAALSTFKRALAVAAAIPLLKSENVSKF